MLKKLIKGISVLWYYIWGNFFALCYYDKKYLTGRYFEGKYKGLATIGWKWATQDGIARLFFGTNKHVPWPVSYKATISHPENIIFHPDDLHIFQTHGTYYQGVDGKIIIGKGAWIAPNVGFITANHNIEDFNTHSQGEDIILGEKCWIGMNAMILPGVELGEGTVVGAGSVVTKSFKEGHYIIGGNPAKIIRNL